MQRLFLSRMFHAIVLVVSLFAMAGALLLRNFGLFWGLSTLAVISSVIALLMHGFEQLAQKSLLTRSRRLIMASVIVLYGLPIVEWLLADSIPWIRVPIFGSAECLLIGLLIVQLALRLDPDKCSKS